MKFKLINRKITFTDEGQMIFSAELFVDNDPFANPARLPKYVETNQAVIREIVDNPSDYEYVDNMFPYEKQLDGVYLKIDKYGMPVMEDGHAIMRHTLLIWQKKVVDPETGKLVWAKDPESIITRILNHYYIPLEVG